MKTYRKLFELFTVHADAERLRALDADSWLQDLGLDSIAMMGLVVDVEDTFGVVLDQRTLFELRTVADLVRWIDQQEAA